jgi:ATP/ADP translocase
VTLVFVTIMHAEWAKDLLIKMGPRFAGPIAIIRNWTYCLFYVMAELWGSVVVSVLFWGFANQITTVDEAKQFYPLFGLGANVALIFSGRAVKIFSQVGDVHLLALSSQAVHFLFAYRIPQWPGSLPQLPMLPTLVCRFALACPLESTAGACPCVA